MRNIIWVHCCLSHSITINDVMADVLCLITNVQHLCDIINYRCIPKRDILLTTGLQLNRGVHVFLFIFLCKHLK